MMDELSWHIGKSGTGQERLDTPPYKAYFFWKRDGQIISTAEYSKAELQAEIQKRKKAGEEVIEFEKALKQLG